MQIRQAIHSEHAKQLDTEERRKSRSKARLKLHVRQVNNDAQRWLTVSRLAENLS